MSLLKSKAIVVLTHTAFAPADSSTYTYGTDYAAPLLNGSPYTKFYPFMKGKIRSIHFNLVLNNGKTSSSSENVGVYLRLNNTTDYTITTTADFGGASRTNKQYTVTNLDIPLTVSDFIEAKLVFPSMTTNPVSVITTMTVVIDSF
jgi:hypothetical protein